MDIVLRDRETDCTVACKVPGKENNKTAGIAGNIQRARGIMNGGGLLEVLQSNDYLPCGAESWCEVIYIDELYVNVKFTWCWRLTTAVRSASDPRWWSI